jgi:AcrR family transcriptional regulator
MTTKERITEESLTLFSTKGFKGTSVKDIADRVGIKDSSLYKHFKSKQEILDHIVLEMNHRIAKLPETSGLPAWDDLKKSAQVYGALDETMLTELSQKIFLFYLKDPHLSRFWRMGNMEQYHNPAVYSVFRKLFLVDSITYQSALFAEMVQAGILIDINPEVIAMSFYAPIYFLLSKYAAQPEKEGEALHMLSQQVREFYRIYRKKDAD